MCNTMLQVTTILIHQPYTTTQQQLALQLHLQVQLHVLAWRSHVVASWRSTACAAWRDMRGMRCMTRCVVGRIARVLMGLNQAANYNYMHTAV